MSHVRRERFAARATAGLTVLMAACGSAPVLSEGDAAIPPAVEVEVTVAGQEGAQVGTQSPTDDPSAALKAALEAKDYAELEAMMAPNFGFGLIASEGMSYTPAEFVTQLEQTYLGPGSVQVDLVRDIRAEVGSDYQHLVDSYAQTLYSTGWGEARADSALLFLNQQGQWAGMLYMFEGLEQLLFAGGSTGSGGTVAQSTPESDGGQTAALPDNVDNHSLAGFQGALLEAITTDRDYILLQALMGDPFVIGYWRSEGQSLAPAAAEEELRTSLLPPEAFITYTFGDDFSDKLDGQNPLTMWGPDANAVRAIFSTGWGPDGSDEAILIIAQRPDGTYYWHGLLYAQSGF